MKSVANLALSSCAVGALFLWSSAAHAEAARSCTGAPIADKVAAADPLQKGHFATTQPAAAPGCNVPRVAPDALEPAASFHYKAFTFKNRSREGGCVTVATTPAVAGATATAAYLGAFDPADIKKNYLSDSPAQFSVSVPALADFVVVVTSTAAADVGFNLTVGGCGQMVLTGITPAFGPVTGNTPITITGSGFDTASPLRITIGAMDAMNVTWIDDSTVKATTSANAAGTYDVVATSIGNAAITSTLPKAFAYGATSAPDGGADAGDAGADAASDAAVDAGAGGPTTGGPTTGGNPGGSDDGTGDTTTDDGGAGGPTDDTDGGAASDGGAKRVSSKKPRTVTEEDTGFGCNEVGRPVSGIGTFAMTLLGLAALLRKRTRR